MESQSLFCLLLFLLPIALGSLAHVHRADAPQHTPVTVARGCAAFAFPGHVVLRGKRAESRGCRVRFQTAKISLQGRRQSVLPLCMQDKDPNEANERPSDKNSNASTILQSCRSESNGEDQGGSIEEARMMLMRIQNTSAMLNESLDTTRTL
ncbi:hypothetical protein GUITHDRAFT_151924, partial [Guillardia theta CCMP2712]